MAVGRFRLPVRRSGIRCHASWEIQCVVLTVLNSFSRQSFLVSTNVTSALEVFLNDMRYINSRLLTYLLTYFPYPYVCVPARQHCLCCVCALSACICVHSYSLPSAQCPIYLQWRMAAGPTGNEKCQFSGRYPWPPIFALNTIPGVTWSYAENLETIAPPVPEL